MKIWQILLIAINFIHTTNSTIQCNTTKYPLPFSQVIIWGVKLHSHTHSYIHEAFYRAFKQLGYSVYWLDSSDDTSNINLSNTLFLTVGLADKGIPLRMDCWYILHNIDTAKYTHLLREGRCVIMQVYSHDCHNRPVAYIDDCICYDLQDKTLYMPWATNLLPHEIDLIKKQLPSIKKEYRVGFVGSKWGGWQGNAHELDVFEKACKAYRIPFTIAKNLDLEDHIKNIQTSLIAPAIQGRWQCENGYIPCRIFKNISYGQYGITNSERVYKLFHKKIIYNPDCYQLLFDAMDKISHITIEQQYELMDFVRDNHTYINRIDNLLNVLNQINEMQRAHKIVWSWLLT